MFTIAKRIYYLSFLFQWDLVCDREQLTNVVQSCTMFGVLVGNFLFSSVADRYRNYISLIINFIYFHL